MLAPILALLQEPFLDQQHPFGQQYRTLVLRGYPKFRNLGWLLQISLL